MKKLILATSLLTICSASSFSETQKLADALKDPQSPASELSNFGFGPAFFMIAYNKEVLKDSKDVRIRGDKALTSSGSKFGTAVGLEVHYDFAFASNRKGYLKDSSGNTVWTHSNGHIVSPFIGLYDVDNGINGLAAGVMYGYWKGDNKFQNRTSLNMGLGYTVHRSQLVLGDGLEEGAIPGAGLTVDDYTTRKDVDGYVAMVSVSTDF